jgi:hypothetical protein
MIIRLNSVVRCFALLGCWDKMFTVPRTWTTGEADT